MLLCRLSCLLQKRALLRHGVAHHEVLKHVDQLGLVHGVIVVPVSAGVEPCVEVVDVLQLQEIHLSRNVRDCQVHRRAGHTPLVRGVKRETVPECLLPTTDAAIAVLTVPLQVLGSLTGHGF